MHYLWLIALFFSFSAQAKVFQLQGLQGQSLQANYYLDGGRAVVEEIQRGADGWPELKARHEFGSANEAQAFLHKNFISSHQLPTVDELQAPLLTGAADELWPVTQKWNWEWEKKYAAWLRAEFKEDFFQKINLRTDCADVAYSVRWIFARINGLPMVSRLSTGEWISQKSVRASWSRLPSNPDWTKDKKFLAALDYILELTYTHSLANDLYPIAIESEALIEGTVALRTHDESGHTRVINGVFLHGEGPLPISILQSTTPRIVRRLMPDGLWDSEIFKKGQGGLMHFRWPAPSGKGLVAATSMPFYSEEQYDESFVPKNDRFYNVVYKRLIPGFDLNDVAMHLLESIQQLFLQRQQTVNDGYVFCQSHDCSPNSANYDGWSTPSRDAAIYDRLRNLNQILYSLTEEQREKINLAFKRPFIQLEGIPFSLDMLSWVWSNAVYSSDPRVEPSTRWGASPKGLISYINKKCSELWAERESLLKKYPDPCSSKICDKTTAKEYQNRQSFNIDQKLLRLNSVGTNYCSVVPESVCQEFEHHLSEPNQILNDGRSLSDLLASFVNLNSDPRVSAEIRRGGSANLFKQVKLKHALKSASADYLFEMSADLNAGIKSRLLSVSGAPIEIKAPLGEWIWFDQENKIGWFAQEKVLGWNAVVSGEVKSILLDFYPQEISPLGAGRFAVLGGANLGLKNTLAVLALSNGELRLESGPWTGDSIDRIASSVFLGKKDNRYSLLNLRDGFNENFLVGSNFPAFKNLLRAFEIESGWILSYYIDSTFINYFIRKKDFTVRTIWDGYYSLMIASKGSPVLLQAPAGEILLAEVSEDNRILSSKKFALKSSSRNFVSVQDAAGGMSFYIEAGQLRYLRAKPGEDYLVEWNGEFVVAKRGNNFLVRRVDDSAVLMENDAPIHLLGNTGAAKSLVGVCDSIVLQNQGVESWSSQCRLEDVLNPKRYSLFTNIDNWPKADFDVEGLLLGFSDADSNYWLNRK